jgi:hypothetical protein
MMMLPIYFSEDPAALSLPLFQKLERGGGRKLTEI